MVNSALFEFRIGGGVRPDTLRARELAAMIVAIEDAVAATAAHESPAVDEDRLSISLVAVSDGSARLKFGSNTPKLALAAYLVIARCVTARDYAPLPPKAVSALHDLDAFAKRRNAPLTFYGDGADPDKLAEIDPHDDLQLPRHQTFYSETELHGRLERLGGSKPRARLVRDNGEVVYCDLSESLARQIGSRIYESIGLLGRAEWDTDTWTVISFRAEKLLDYEAGSLVDAFGELREASRGAWDHVENVDTYISELRR